MARAYDSGLFELEEEAGGIWGSGLRYGEQAGYSPLGYSPMPLDQQWFGQPQAEAKRAPLPPLPPLPPLDPRPFGGNAQLQTAAQQLAQLRGSRVVKSEVERLYRVALQAAERAARRARSNVAAARAAVARPEPAQVQAQTTAEYEAWLTEDYRLTMEGARARYGESWRKQMRSLGPAERDTFYANTVAKFCRAWLIARREQLDFNTLAAASLRSLQNFQPPAAQGGLIVSPLIPGSDEEPVAPIVVTFVQELKKRYPGFSATTYRNHGFGAFLRRGYSIDLFLNSPQDDRGFYARTAAETFLRQIHEAARAVNVEWRVLYNDFAVADTINGATGVRHVFFVGSPVTVQRGGMKYGTGINWHGPAPLILHFHLDIVPLASTSGSNGAAESGQFGFQDPQVCQRLEAEYCFMASRLRALPREIANKKDDLQGRNTGSIAGAVRTGREAFASRRLSPKNAASRRQEFSDSGTRLQNSRDRRRSLTSGYRALGMRFAPVVQINQRGAEAGNLLCQEQMIFNFSNGSKSSANSRAGRTRVVVAAAGARTAKVNGRVNGNSRCPVRRRPASP